MDTLLAFVRDLSVVEAVSYRRRKKSNPSAPQWIVAFSRSVACNTCVGQAWVTDSEDVWTQQMVVGCVKVNKNWRTLWIATATKEKQGILLCCRMVSVAFFSAGECCVKVNQNWMRPFCAAHFPRVLVKVLDIFGKKEQRPKILNCPSSPPRPPPQCIYHHLGGRNDPEWGRTSLLLDSFSTMDNASRTEENLSSLNAFPSPTLPRF